MNSSGNRFIKWLSKRPSNKLRGSEFKARQKDFFLLLQGQAVSSFGDAIYSVIVGLWIYQSTGSMAAMGLVFSASNLAKLLFFPFSGWIVDRFSRRRLILLCDTIRGLFMCFLGILLFFFDTSGLWPLVFYGIVSGLCASIFNPALKAMLLSIVGKGELIRANSLYQAATYGVDIFGQAVAGSAYIFLGAPAMFLANGLTFLFSALTELFIRRDPEPTPEKRIPFRKSAMDGLRFILAHPGVRINLALSLILNVAGGVLRVLLVPWISAYGEQCYGILGAVQSAGVLAGSLLLSVVTISAAKRHRVFLGCLILSKLFLILAAFTNFFPLIAIFYGFSSIYQYVYNALLNAMVTLAVPDHLRGKVFCAIQALAMSCAPLGNLIGGIFGEKLPPKHLIVLVMSFCLAIILLFGSRPSMKHLLAGSPEDTEPQTL